MLNATVSAAIKEAADILHQNGIEASRLEAEILMEYFLGVTREKLLMSFSEDFPLEKKQRYLKLVYKRSQNYPLQYITGEQEFMGLKFQVNENVLIPRRETEELVERVLAANIEKGAVVVDIGTGSGAIAISIARFRPDLKVFAVDIDDQALTTAKTNAKNLNVQIEFLKGDLLMPLIAEGIKADAVVSNPPYISLSEMEILMPEVKYEPRLALAGGRDGLDYYRRLALQSPEVLTAGGNIFLEIGCEQGKSVQELLCNSGFRNVEVIRDYQGRDRIVTGIMEI